MLAGNDTNNTFLHGTGYDIMSGTVEAILTMKFH